MPIECKITLPLPAAHDEMSASVNVCCHYGFFFTSELLLYTLHAVSFVLT